MAGVNKVILVGNLGSDPEIKYLESGQPICNFSVATNETWTGKDGQKNERTEWHRVVVWGKLGELCNEYLHKGKQVYVEGRLQTRSWEGQDGEKKYMTEVVATHAVFLGGIGDSARSDSGGFSRGSRRPAESPAADGEF